MAGILDRLINTWNVFTNQSEVTDKIRQFKMTTPSGVGSYGGGVRSDRIRSIYSVDRTVVTSIFTRMSVDAAGYDIRHVTLDEHNRYKEDYSSQLNECLNISANIDQAGRFFRQDVFLSLITNGTVAIVPVEVTKSPVDTMSYDIQTLRVAEIIEWFPATVRVRVYNHLRGVKEEIELPKEFVGIVENPFYSIMNEPNSTLQRLHRKLSLLDVTDENTSSGKLDLIIQLPYVIKTEARRREAEKRRKDVEFQLKSSTYGIAYVDGTEKIVQLNRPVENNLFKQIEYWTELLYSQLGITKEILSGTADEEAMTNYYARTINPIVEAVVEEMNRKFLTKTARTQRQAIRYYRDPFKLLSPSKMAEAADKLARNEIVTSNEVRGSLGLVPSDDPNADKLRNSNMPQPSDGTQPQTTPQLPTQLDDRKEPVIPDGR